MNLTPLREIEPTDDEIQRVLRRAAEAEAAAAAGATRAPRRRRARPAFAAVAALTVAAIAVAAALPGSQSATSALQAAAAAAADQPGPADFSGYRYVEMIDRRKDTWATMDEKCMRRHGLPRPATPDPKPQPAACPFTASVKYSEEGRQEIWVDSAWQGTRRDHGSRLTDVTGDAELASALRREFGREATTDEYVYGDGPFARAPLRDLPTDPDALLRTLTAAYEDGRWAQGGQLHPSIGPDVRRYELASFTAHLLAEANATPALRAAAFGVLERMEGVTDLGRVKDSQGREGHGVEVSGRRGPAAEGTEPVRVRVIFDPEQGDVLSWGEYRDDAFTEFVLLRTAHVKEQP